MPEDHFVSLDAGETEGRFQSKPWGPPFEIFVNADVQGGSIQVELVTPDGEVIRDFARADCLPITTSGRNQRIAWRSGRRPWDLRSDHRGGISARFYLRRARLYSYTMTMLDPDGKLARDKRTRAGSKPSNTARTTGAGEATSLPAASHRAASLESGTARPFR